MAPSVLDPKHKLFDVTAVSLVCIISIIAITVGHGIGGGKPLPVSPAAPPSVPQTPPVTVPPEPIVMPFSGRTAEGSSSEVDGGYLPSWAGSATAILQWSDDYGNNDVFRLELLVNGTAVGQQEGSSGELMVASQGHINGTVGARVTAVSCPGIVGISPIDRDSGNGWQMVIEIVPEA